MFAQTTFLETRGKPDLIWVNEGYVSSFYVCTARQIGKSAPNKYIERNFLWKKKQLNFWRN